MTVKGHSFLSLPRNRQVSVKSFVNSVAELRQAVDDDVRVSGIMEPGAHFFHGSGVVEKMPDEMIVIPGNRTGCQVKLRIRPVTFLHPNHCLIVGPFDISLHPLAFPL